MTNSYWTCLNSKLFCILFFVIVFEHFISVGLIPYFVKLENMAAKKVSNATFHLNCHHHLRQGPLLRFEPLFKASCSFPFQKDSPTTLQYELDRKITVNKQDVTNWHILKSVFNENALQSGWQTYCQTGCGNVTIWNRNNYLLRLLQGKYFLHLQGWTIIKLHLPHHINSSWTISPSL